MPGNKVTYQLSIQPPSPPTFSASKASATVQVIFRDTGLRWLDNEGKESLKRQHRENRVWNTALATQPKAAASQGRTISAQYFQCFHSLGDQPVPLPGKQDKTKRGNNCWKQLCSFSVLSIHSANVCTSLQYVSTLEDFYLHPLLQPQAGDWSWSSHSWKRWKQHVLNQHFSLQVKNTLVEGISLVSYSNVCMQNLI